MKKRHLVIISIILCIALASFHIIWFCNLRRYQPYIEAVGTDEYGRYSCIDDSKTTYSVFPPSYPSFSGNLAICDFRSDDLQPGDTVVDMLIWPNGETYKIGISIQTIKSSQINGDSETGIISVSTESVNFELDEQGNFLKEYDATQIKLFEENKATIETYYEKAYKMWGILGTVQEKMS